MKTILITGATGFVGSHVLEYLMNAPAVKIIAACRNKTDLLPGFKGQVRQGDLRDKVYLDGLLEGVDIVVHAAAWSSLWGAEKKSKQLFLDPTMNLIDRFFASNADRFINVSTTSAAAPENSADPNSVGIDRPFWPHLGNLIKIENSLRARATSRKTTGKTTGKTVVNMRLGTFIGERYGLGLLPVLLPRLKTHLVPWVGGGRTRLPLIDGRDIGQAIGLATMAPGLEGFCSFNVVGRQSPTVRELIGFLHKEFGYPKPHFGVPFAMAYPFAWLMEKLDAVVPWEPLIVRSIVHLLEETGADNTAATAALGYQPKSNWQDVVRLQAAQIRNSKGPVMKLAIAEK